MCLWHMRPVILSSCLEPHGGQAGIWTSWGMATTVEKHPSGCLGQVSHEVPMGRTKATVVIDWPKWPFSWQLGSSTSPCELNLSCWAIWSGRQASKVGNRLSANINKHVGTQAITWINKRVKAKILTLVSTIHTSSSLWPHFLPI